VIEVEGKRSIHPKHLKNLELKQGEALLFKTDNSMSGILISGEFTEDFVSLSPEAADFCVEKKWSLLGIDYVTIGKFGEESVDVHRKLLGHGILILEGINLKAVPPGRYTLICLPLRINGGEGSPVRAVLLK
jgi:arylformamidase